MVGPMDRDELRQAIERPGPAGRPVRRERAGGPRGRRRARPARRAAAGLPRAARDLARAPGPVLTLAGYQAAGGVTGALARTADTSTPGSPTTQAVGAAAVPAPDRPRRGHRGHPRRVARRGAGLDDVDAVVDALVAARLVIVDDDTVELTHEALIGAWPRLRDWLAEDRDGLRTHRLLTEAAAAWRSLDERPRLALPRAHGWRWPASGPADTATTRSSPRPRRPSSTPASDAESAERRPPRCDACASCAGSPGARRTAARDHHGRAAWRSGSGAVAVDQRDLATSRDLATQSTNLARHRRGRGADAQPRRLRRGRHAGGPRRPAQRGRPAAPTAGASQRAAR